MEMSGQLHALGRFTPSERASDTHLIGWVGPRADLDEVATRNKSLPQSVIEPWSSSP